MNKIVGPAQTHERLQQSLVRHHSQSGRGSAKLMDSSEAVVQAVLHWFDRLQDAAQQAVGRPDLKDKTKAALDAWVPRVRVRCSVARQRVASEASKPPSRTLCRTALPRAMPC